MYQTQSYPNYFLLLLSTKTKQKTRSKTGKKIPIDYVVLEKVWKHLEKHFFILFKKVNSLNINVAM